MGGGVLCVYLLSDEILPDGFQALARLVLSETFVHPSDIDKELKDSTCRWVLVIMLQPFGVVVTSEGDDAGGS